MKKTALLVLTGCLLTAVTFANIPTVRKAQKGSDATAASATINAADILRHIKMLSSDEFEGRGPGTKGEDLSVQYLTDQLKQMGLKPGNPDGSYVQKVPLVGFTTTGTAAISAGGHEIALKRNEDYVAISRRFTPQIDVNDSDVIFVGYGVVAPEYGWDDYKGVDVRGKTIVMLVNDPAVPDPKDPTKKDPAFFKGNAMTYYGRWTYKYEIAAEKGAAAAIIVHDTIPAGYPFEVVTGSWGRENFDIQTPDKNMGRAAVEGWISNPKARELMTAAGQDLDALQRAAVRKDFKPVPLNAKASFHLQNQLRDVNSQNVIAKLEGSDARSKNEYVVYSAHWDHLGKDPNRQGDQIFNGAIDNASGCAGLLELADAYSKLTVAPKRSVLFLFVTAEEKGLLGSKYYASNPLYPLNKTLANINMDGLNQWGRTKDLAIVGYGNSTLDDVLKAKAAAQNRTVGAEKEPEKGTFYRSDHFEFAKKGVPALYVHSGDDFIGKPAGYAQEKRDQYTANDYHKPSDEIKPDWDLSGAVEDLQLLFAVGYDVLQGSKWPEWKPGTEFKAKRDASLGKTRASVERCPHYKGCNPPPVVSISLSTEEVYSCVNPTISNAEHGRTPDPVVLLNLDVSAPDPDTFRYTYSVTGGTIQGSGRRVVWDFSTAQPGQYKAVVEVDAGCGLLSMTDTIVTVKGGNCASSSNRRTEALNLNHVLRPPTSDLRISVTPSVLPYQDQASDSAKPLLSGDKNTGLVSIKVDDYAGDAGGLELTYSVSSGKILQADRESKWDLTGSDPGIYKIVARVYRGDQLVDVAVQQVEIQGPADEEEAAPGVDSVGSDAADSSEVIADSDTPEFDSDSDEESDISNGENGEITSGCTFRPLVPTVSLAASVDHVYWNAGPAKDNSPRNVVVLEASAKDPMYYSLLYTYEVTAGQIKGQGASVKWDLNGVPPGKYKALVEINNGVGFLSFDVVEVTVY